MSDAAGLSVPNGPRARRRTWHGLRRRGLRRRGLQRLEARWLRRPLGHVLYQRHAGTGHLSMCGHVRRWWPRGSLVLDGGPHARELATHLVHFSVSRLKVDVSLLQLGEQRSLPTVRGGHLLL
jgi:hypothetical protein